MAREIKRINIGPLPELLRLAKAARRDNRIYILTDEGEEVARLSPSVARHSSRAPRRSPDAEAFLSAAGAWKDIDTDRLIADIYDSRARSSRPPIQL
jgi:hypothetical protein